MLEKYGLVIDAPIQASTVIERRRDETRAFEIRGFLPTVASSRSVIEISEQWLTMGADLFERAAYRYELVDAERGYRRAFHRHNDAQFERHFGVVVHEHCESPIGHAPCPHFFGAPVRDGYRGIELLLKAWVADPPECAALPCLEPI